MGCEYKYINVVFKMILHLCLSGIVFSSMSQGVGGDISGSRLLEDVTLKTVTVYLAWETEVPCLDTLVIKDINFRVKKYETFGGYPAGCGDVTHSMMLLINDTSAIVSVCGMYQLWWWNTKGVYYPLPSHK